MRWLFVMLVLLSCQLSVAAPTHQANATAEVYSAYCFDREASDVSGARITLLHFYDGRYVAFQLAEGAFTIPSIAKINFNNKTGAVSFTINDNAYKLTFVGKLSPERLEGRMSWKDPGYPSADLKLNRVRGGHEQYSYCQ